MVDGYKHFNNSWFGNVLCEGCMWWLLATTLLCGTLSHEIHNSLSLIHYCVSLSVGMSQGIPDCIVFPADDNITDDYSIHVITKTQIPVTFGYGLV